MKEGGTGEYQEDDTERNNLLKTTDRGREIARDDRGNSVRETGRKILAVFVWQQQAEQPQGHVNEGKAFQRWGESPAGAELE